MWRGGQGRPLPLSCARLAIYLFYMVSYHLFRCACRHERSATGFLSNPIARRAGIRTRPNSGRRARARLFLFSRLSFILPLCHTSSLRSSSSSFSFSPLSLRAASASSLFLSLYQFRLWRTRVLLLPLLRATPSGPSLEFSAFANVSAALFII